MPASITSLTNLQSLSLADCPLLHSLPNSLSLLASLTRLLLDTCPKLDTAPQLTNLRLLHWQDQGQTLPSFLFDATRVTMLRLLDCGGVQHLPDTITKLAQLKDLRLAGCSSLQELPMNITRLAHLESLSLSRCEALQSLPHNLQNLQNLRYLHCDGCGQLQGLPREVGQLPRLKILSLAGCVKLQSLPKELSNVRTLEQLDLSDCEQLETFPLSIGNLPRLGVLRLDACPKIPDETLFKIPYRPTLEKALVGARQRQAVRTAFVVGQQHTLEQSITAVSWIGILLATASFLGFVSVPGGFQPGGVVRVGEVGAPYPALNQSALSLYFASDMATFLMALATTVYAVTQTMPNTHEPTAWEVLVQAGMSSFLLLISVAFGVVTFVSGAFAVYPVNRGSGLLLAAITCGALLVVIALAFLIRRVWRLGAALQWGKELPEVVEPPASGEAKLLREMLTVLQEIRVRNEPNVL